MITTDQLNQVDQIISQYSDISLTKSASKLKQRLRVAIETGLSSESLNKQLYQVCSKISAAEKAITAIRHDWLRGEYTKLTRDLKSKEIKDSYNLSTIRKQAAFLRILLGINRIIKKKDLVYLTDQETLNEKHKEKLIKEVINKLP